MSKITSPQSFFGHQMGEDRKIARWDKIVEYFQQLAKESDRIQITDMGPSTEGHPFLLATISSPENLARLEEIRQINLKLGDPRGLTEEALDSLIAQGKSIVVQSMSLHASEIGGTQMAPELAYDLLSCDCADTKRILDNVVFLMVPCFNPDGQHMVTDWYNRYVGTEFEGASLPWLYHKYSGHDNNRDAFAQNLVESQYMGKIVFQDWRPHVYQDHHHMGSNGARLYVAPYCNPMHPNMDPLIAAQLMMYGAAMAVQLEGEGKQGILAGGQFPNWGHLGYHWLTNHHNIVGMLTESASARLATPLYIPPEQLEAAGDKSFPVYGQQSNFVNPWKGGWWRLRDIVEQQKIAAWAVLDCAARNRDTVLRNAVTIAQRQICKGKSEAPYAFVIPKKQHDALTARKLVHALERQGFELQVLDEDCHIGGKLCAKGSVVVSTAQAKRPAIITLLDRTLYPDNYWTTNLKGEPTVFDASTDTLAEFMGVSIARAEQPLTAATSLLTELPALKGGIAACNPEKFGFVFSSALNDSYRLANQLLSAGCKVWRATEAVPCGDSCAAFPKGSFITGLEAKDQVQAGAAALGIHVASLISEVSADKKVELLPLRLAVYQRYYGGNMEEGWTRLVLENFEFPYTTVMNNDLKAGNLKEKFDVLLIPADRPVFLTDISKAGNDPVARMAQRWIGSMPEEYMGGMGDQGAKAVKEFVNAGGRLVTFGSACDFAIDTLGMGLKNVLNGLSSQEFLTHGSTLKMELCSESPIAWGMPKKALAMHWDCPAYAITDNRNAEKYQVVGRYPATHVLHSGRLVGEQKIANRAAILHVPHGKGDAVLLGIGVQKRAQMHGTFKLLFNSIMLTK